MQTEFDVTWVGHATTLIELDGFRVLADPSSPIGWRTCADG